MASSWPFTENGPSGENTAGVRPHDRRVRERQSRRYPEIERGKSEPVTADAPLVNALRTQEEAEAFFQETPGSQERSQFISQVCSGYVRLQVIQHPKGHTVARLREFVGPESLEQAKEADAAGSTKYVSQGYRISRQRFERSISSWLCPGFRLCGFLPYTVVSRLSATLAVSELVLLKTNPLWGFNAVRATGPFNGKWNSFFRSVRTGTLRQEYREEPQDLGLSRHMHRTDFSGLHSADGVRRSIPVAKSPLPEGVNTSTAFTLGGGKNKIVRGRSTDTSRAEEQCGEHTRLLRSTQGRRFAVLCEIIRLSVDKCPVERTFALIKPDAVAAGVCQQIEDEILDAGLLIICRKQVQITEATFQALYEEHSRKVSCPCS